MKMADVKVGMRLVSTKPLFLSPITVTDIIKRGRAFKYNIDECINIIHQGRRGYLSTHGHEMSEVDGDVPYEPQRLLPSPIKLLPPPRG